MKEFDKKDVFSWANCEQAKAYIGKNCYFADNLEQLKEKVNEDNNLELIGVFDKETYYPVQSTFRDANTDYWGLCLPADKVKEVEEEKKWRAFRTFEEFILVLGTIGCHVRFRFKDDKDNEFLAIVNGFNYKAQSITINAVRYTFIELFDKFEFYKNQEWQPFGVLDEN